MKRILFFLIIVLFIFIGSHAQSIYPGQFVGKSKVKDKAQMKVYSFDLDKIKLLNSPFKDNMERNSQWIMCIGVDQYLHSFFTNAGIYAGIEGGYHSVAKLGGWESLDCELRGHIVGHVLSALAYLYSQTGDEKYKLKSDSIVNGLSEVQNVLGKNGHEGYVSAFPENLIDRNIAGKRVWAPWYVLHKIYSGLIDQYLYCHNSKALNIALNAANWTYDKLSLLNDNQRRRMILNEFGGMNEVFWNLYAITGNQKYKKLAQFFYDNEILDPLIHSTEDLNKKHSNTFIPKVIGEARNYELNAGKNSRLLCEHFWNQVIDHQTFCTGGNGTKEKFIPSDKLSENLTGYTQESCCTYNMLKLTKHLFCWTADLKYADYYERALYNHILGQQDPETGMLSYFLPLLPGSFKVYSTPMNSFWCCVGSGFESQSKFAESIYFHDNEGIYVNLYIPSTLSYDEKKTSIVQTEDFPNNSHVKFSIQTDYRVRFSISLRYPYWASNVVVKVNGKKISVKQKPSTYIKLERTWKTGDQIEAFFPMDIHREMTNDNKNIVAILYGPYVLAGEMGKVPEPFSNPEKYNDYYTYNYRVSENIKKRSILDMDKLYDSIKLVDGEDLGFSIPSQSIRLKPIYEFHRQRYIVYWNLKN